MRERIDIILVEQGFARSREIAKNMIKAGEVLANGKVVEKASAGYETEGLSIEVRSNEPKYVSRGGFKLEKAIKSFSIELQNLVCMDVGASTGGFSDCMLQEGALSVYSVDVGHDQLAEKIRLNPKVHNYEGTNFRYSGQEDFPEKMDFISVDVSFISLAYILTPAYSVLKANGKMVCLIKPQFEAGKDKVGKKGVVKERSVHKEVITKVIEYAKQSGFSVLGIDFSPIKGPEGNIEYLIYLQKAAEGEATMLVDGEKIISVIQLAHQNLE